MPRTAGDGARFVLGKFGAPFGVQGWVKGDLVHRAA